MSKSVHAARRDGGEVHALLVLRGWGVAVPTNRPARIMRASARDAGVIARAQSETIWRKTMLPPKDGHVRSVELAHKISDEMCRHFCKRISNCGFTDERIIFSIAVIAIVRLIQGLDDEDPNAIKPYGLLGEHIVLLLTEPEKVIAGGLTAADLPELKARFPELDFTEAELAEIKGRAA